MLANQRTKLLVIQVAALGHDFVKKFTPTGKIAGLNIKPLTPVFPAVTCAAQATFKTGLLPNGHGMVGNGYFSRDLNKPMFWEQSSELVKGERVWDDWQRKGRTVGTLFWQQSIGRDSDIVLSPAPIHKHHGGMILDCFSRPSGLYPKLRKKFGEFPLSKYWGPTSGVAASRWIANATKELCRTDAADLLLTYLPHLDYELQKSGPNSDKSAYAYTQLVEILRDLIKHAKISGYKILLWGDYAITRVHKVIHPNMILGEAGLFKPRSVRKMLYPDINTSHAFAVVDHQVAHVYVNSYSLSKMEDVRKCFEGHEGIAKVLVGPERGEVGLDTNRAGDVVLVAKPDYWFAYSWWKNKKQAPEYATHIDIHNKPGYDPCELFWGMWPISVSTDERKVKGSHGLMNDAVWASDCIEKPCANLLELAAATKEFLTREA